MGRQSDNDKSKTDVDQPLLDVRQLACRRGDRLLFRQLDFKLHAGNVLHLTGPNGVGKSSLLRVLAGLLPIYSGAVEHIEQFSLCDGSLPLDKDLTLDKALDYWSGFDEAGLLVRKHVFATLQLDMLYDVPVRIFSTGQRKRAALAMIALQGRKIWLLDEPSNGLDHASQNGLAYLMMQHCASGGAVIFASHQPIPVPDQGYPPDVKMETLDLQGFVS